MTRLAPLFALVLLAACSSDPGSPEGEAGSPGLAGGGSAGASAGSPSVGGSGGSAGARVTAAGSAGMAQGGSAGTVAKAGAAGKPELGEAGEGGTGGAIGEAGAGGAGPLDGEQWGHCNVDAKWIDAEHPEVDCSGSLICGTYTVTEGDSGYNHICTILCTGLEAQQQCASMGGICYANVCVPAEPLPYAG